MLQSQQILIQPKFAPAEYKRTIWHAQIDHSTTLEDILQPEFFSNVCAEMRVGDRIECYDEAGTYFIELMVSAVAERTPTKAPNWAKTCVLRYCDLVGKDDKKLALPDGFYTKFRGGAKWSVMRKSDETVLVERQVSEADAIREFLKQQKKMVA